ncbi:MAG: hypothetical protein ACYSU5_21990 [Planctomycetota bacterium]|jgi:hypothetical protein
MTSEDTCTIAWRNDSEIAAIGDVSVERLRQDVTIRHPSHEPQIVKILRQNLVTKMSPQMLILPESSPRKC